MHIYIKGLVIILIMTSCQHKSESTKSDNSIPVSFTTDEGTWMNIDVSPDGKTLLFDLLGDIYTMPMTGGKASPLRIDRSWDLAPKYSPDGNKIAFVSDFSGGKHQLCVMNLDGSNPKQVSNEATVHGAPAWLADGTKLVGTKDYKDRTLAKQYSIIDTSTTKLPKNVNGWYGPVISKKTGNIYFSRYNNKDILQIWKLDTSNQISQLTNSDSAYHFRPQVSHDEEWLAYGKKEIDYDEKTSTKTSLILRHLGTGKERTLIDSIDDVRLGFINLPFDLLPSFAFTPDDDNIIIAYKGKIHKIEIATGQNTIIPFSVNVLKEQTTLNKIKHEISLDSFKAKQIHAPSFHPNQNTVVFEAVGKIWYQDLKKDKPVRLTQDSIKAFTPKFSPDGKKVAYTTWSDKDKGHIMVFDMMTKKTLRLTDQEGFYINPTWSPDGQSLACIASIAPDQSYESLSDSKDLGIYVFNGLKKTAVRVADYTKLAIQNILSYAPLYFDNSGKYIFYSFNSGGRENQLKRVDLANKTTETVLNFPNGINYISPSPDGKKFVLVGNHDMFLLENLNGLDTNKTIKREDLYGLQATIPKLGTTSATMLEWHKDGSLFWNFTNELYKWESGDNNPEKLLDINLNIHKKQHTPQEMVYEHARIVTINNNQVIEDGYVVVSEGKIKDVGKMADLESNNQRLKINCSGRTVIPGLIDVHAHFHYSGNNVFTDIKPDYIANLAYGVTTIFDPAAYSNTAFSLAELVESGSVLGPRVFSSGASVLSNKNNWGHVQIDSLADAVKVVQQLKQSGAIMIKSYTQPLRDQKQWLIEAAKFYDIGVTLESSYDQMNYYTGMLDGHNAIEHNPLYMPIYKDVINYYAKTGVQITTTFGIFNIGSVFFDNERYKPDDKLTRFISSKRLKKYGSGIKKYKDLNYLKTAQDLKKVTEAGGLISLGSHGEMAGMGMHWEMWLLGNAGWTPSQILEAATINSAKKIGVSNDLGSIKTGKIADFLILNSNPLDNIRNTTDLKYVVKEGVVYDANTMKRINIQ